MFQLVPLGQWRRRGGEKEAGEGDAERSFEGSHLLRLLIGRLHVAGKLLRLGLVGTCQMDPDITHVVLLPRILEVLEFLAIRRTNESEKHEVVCCMVSLSWRLERLVRSSMSVWSLQKGLPSVSPLFHRRGRRYNEMGCNIALKYTDTSRSKKRTSGGSTQCILRLMNEARCRVIGRDQHDADAQSYGL